jgi:hypothetical protein
MGFTNFLGVFLFELDQIKKKRILINKIIINK